MGPVCDIPGPDTDDPIAKLIDVGDGRVVTYGPIEFPDLDQVMGGPVKAILTRRCRTRELEDEIQLNIMIVRMYLLTLMLALHGH